MNITESTRVSVYTALCHAFVSVKAVMVCFSVNAQQLHYVFVSMHSSYIMYLCPSTAVTLCFCVCALHCIVLLCVCAL